MSRIAIYSDLTGGVFVYSRRLAGALVDAGYDVHVVSYPTESANMPGFEDIGVTVHYLNTPFSDPNHAQDIYRHFVKISPDVVFPNYRNVAFGASAWLTQRKDTRVVAVFHNDHDSYYQLLDRYHSIVSGIICPSRKTLDILSRAYGDENLLLRYIPHGIPLTPGKAEFSKGPIHLIYHGRLVEEQKCLSKLLDVSSELRDRQVPFHLTMLGEGSDADWYRDTISKKLLDDCVSVCASLGWDRLTDALESAHVAVLTSEYEGFCLSLAEGMGAGLPGVAFDCGGVVSDYLKHGENGFLLPFGDVKAMADAIQQLQSSTTLWRQLSDAARQTITEQFGMCLFRDRLTSFIDDVVEHSPAKVWPKIRPVVVRQGRSCSSVVDRIGRLLSAW